MRFSVSSLLLAASCLLGAARAHNIQLAAHGRECFHEELHKDDKMTVTFQVGDREFGSAGNLDVDFWVCGEPLFLSLACPTDTNRSRLPAEVTRYTRNLFQADTTPLLRSTMADIYTVSVMSTGRRIQRTSRSMCMVSFMCQNRRRHQTH